MKHILIIDDDDQMRKLIRSFLERAGFEVEEAANGRLGMAVMRRCAVDLVITDLIMPEQEGLETIGMLKQDFPQVKIIAISGGGRIGPDAYLPAAAALGADRIFIKPFARSALVATVRELLH